jgi:hypothetical protein
MSIVSGREQTPALRQSGRRQAKRGRPTAIPVQLHLITDRVFAGKPSWRYSVSATLRRSMREQVQLLPGAFSMQLGLQWQVMRSS